MEFISRNVSLERELEPGDQSGYNYGPEGAQGPGSNSTFLPDYMTYELDTFRVVMEYLYIYLTPVVIIIGVTTNILSFLVFVFTHMRIQSSSIYLASLAISDSAFLIATFFSWLSWVRIDIIHKPYICHAVVYLTFISSFLSVWIVVSFTVERYIVVCHPFQRQSMCTVRRAKLVVISEAIFAALFYSYALWTTTIIDQGGYKMCSQDERYITFTRYVTYVDSIITLIVPSVAIILLNTRITMAIYQFLKNRWTLNIRVEESRTASSRTTSLRMSRSGDIDNGTRRPKRMPQQFQASQRKPPVQTHVESTQNNSPQMKTTRMLLVVSAVFVALNLPGHVLRIHKIISIDFLDKMPSQTEKRWAELMELVYYVNFSTNFFLYTMITRSFREATKRLCGRIWHHLKNVFPSCVHFLAHGCKRESKEDTLPELQELNIRGDTLHRSSRPASRNITDKQDNINTI